jgi:hypothetical protein
MTAENIENALSVQANFRFDQVSSRTALRAVPSSTPSLGPLAAFAGTFRGHGLNTIFRPNGTQTPTPLPTPPTGPSGNVLEINLTSETLSFSPALGSVPNRGFKQGDIFLNGVPYLQSISDVTVPSQPVGIHFEPGLWIAVPATAFPEEGATVFRMGSIPHGTAIEAQGTSSVASGKPTIPAVDITPFTVPTTGSPSAKIPFPSQTVADAKTERIPQDLAAFIAAGTITQAILTDPNTVLRDHIASQDITETTTIEISTRPGRPLFGGGTDNIAFLLGNPPPAGTDPDQPTQNSNAQATQMTATFWIETVQYVIEVPVHRHGSPPLTIAAPTGEAGQPVPRFLVDPPADIIKPRPVTVTSTQIQYSQHVLLNFNGLLWPHVSVATLVPDRPIPVPASAW